jgi:hypothetical protein
MIFGLKSFGGFEGTVAKFAVNFQRLILAEGEKLPPLDVISVHCSSQTAHLNFSSV